MDVMLSNSTTNMNKNGHINTSKNLRIASTEELKELLRLGIPKYAVTYGLVDMHVRYNIFEGTPVKFFVPTGENVSSLVVVYHDCEKPNRSGRQMIDIHWDVSKASDTDIQEYLKSLPNINWDEPLTVIGTHTIVVEKLNSILQATGLCGESQTMNVFADGDIYSQNGNLTKTTIPDGYRLGPLKPHHAAYVHKMFGNPMDESDEFLSKQFSAFPSIGLYKISADGEKEDLPHAWTSLRMHGNIGRTFTTPDYRLRGFSTIVTMELLKVILDAGFEPQTAISRSNPTSIRMHEKLGFVKQDRYVCATFSPVK